MTFQEVSGPAAHAPLSAPASREAGGPYGWLTPYIEAITAHNEHIAARVLRLRRAELHFIALCLSLMGEKRNDADHLAAFARGLHVLAKQTLVLASAERGGVNAPAALAKAIKHLAGPPWRPPTYLRLAALLNEPQARKTLHHLPAISRRHVMTLARLPETYRTVGVLKMIRQRRDLSEVLFGIELVRRVRTDLDDRQIIASLEKAKSRHIRNWVMRHYARVPFPAPPVSAIVIDGVEALRPLASYSDLERAALEFDNCIRHDLWPVLKGDTYFYRYAPEAGGKGVAIVELRRAPVIGWVVHEALGPRNDPISGLDRATILAAFRRGGIGAAPQAINRDAWFDIG